MQNRVEIDWKLDGNLNREEKPSDRKEKHIPNQGIDVHSKGSQTKVGDALETFLGCLIL